MLIACMTFWACIAVLHNKELLLQPEEHEQEEAHILQLLFAHESNANPFPFNDHENLLCAAAETLHGYMQSMMT